MIASLCRGIWLGFCIAAPVGPIGILVLRQALGRGAYAGLASGFGAALADLSYGCLAVAGVRLASRHGRVVAVIGGVLLLYLAWRLWRETPATDETVPESRGGVRSAGITFLLTLSNPMTILSFAAMVASSGSTAPGYFVAGVFLGSMLWWTILSFSAASLKGIVASRGGLLNRIAAISLASFGLWAIWTKAFRA